MAGVTGPTWRILLVEDDAGIASSLSRALGSQGYAVEHVATGTRARAALRDRGADLVLLDLGLPDVDGVSLCRTITAEHPAIPVLCLTARAEEIDVVVGLEAGAVDYITKPFRLAELLARIRAQLRRGVAVAAEEPTALLTVGPLTLDRASRRAHHHGQEIELRAKEFDLLAELMVNAGQVVTREDLMSRVWDEHWFGSTKTLDVHISGLRRKLGDDAEADRPLIVTLRGIGYRVDLPRSEP